MFGLLDDQFIDDVVTRAEQSRVSYNIQTEEFRNLNANLQTYLTDMKTIDDENRQLQENIEQIRTDYIRSLENHLKRLPQDFRLQSQTLTDAHLERYRSKTRARRFVKEREELKRRINFVASTEKDQVKRLSMLQKQERAVRHEFNKLNEHVQSLLHYVDNEKQNYQQAMDKADHLQVQLEQICVERSRTEFEIQTLKEEVKLMQTAKEFLDDERETLIATQTEANEYLLSRLSESISRIRDDFDELNRAQLKQLENEYQQMLQIVEENLIINDTLDETTSSEQRIMQSDRERLQNEQQSVVQELTTLNDHNQSLSERVFAMESDLHSLRDQRRQEIMFKDNELERSKMELQTLNEKLSHLAEYDRNLKFELTLYRGVLESEYRRKQQQQSTISSPQLMRPTTLPSNNNMMTDRTAWLTSNTQRNKLNDQQREEILTSRDRVQSDYDSLGQEINDRTDDVISTNTTSTNETFGTRNNVQEQLIEPTSREPQQKLSSVTEILQDVKKDSPLTTSPEENQPALRKSLTSSTPPILREEQFETTELQRSPTTPPELQSSPLTPSSIQTSAAAHLTPASTDVPQLFSTASQEDQTLPESQEVLSSRKSSVASALSSDSQRRSSAVNTSTVPARESSISDARISASTPTEEYQSSSCTSSRSSVVSSDMHRRLSVANVHTDPEHQPSSRTLSVDSAVPSDIQRSAVTTTGSENQSLTTDINSSSATSQQHQPSSRTSSIVSMSSDTQGTTAFGTTSAIPEHQPSTADIHQSPLTSLQEGQASSRTSSMDSAMGTDIQKRPSTINTSTVSERKSSISDVRQSPSTPPREHQSVSHASSMDPSIPYNIQSMFVSNTTSTSPEQQPITLDDRQLPSTSQQEHQPSSRTSSVSSTVPTDIQRRLSIVDAGAVPEHQLSSRTSSASSEVPADTQSRVSVANTPAMSEHPSSPRSSSVSSATSSDILRRSSTTNASIVPEQQPATSNDHRSSSISSEQYQPSSRTSSVSSAIPADIQRRVSIGNTPTATEYLPSPRTSSVSSTASPDNLPHLPTTDASIVSQQQPAPLNDRQSPSAPVEEHQPSSRTSSTSSAAPTNTQRRVSICSTPIVIEHPPSSRSSSASSATSYDILRRSSTADASIVSEEKPATSDVRQSTSTAPQESQSSSRSSSVSSAIPSDNQRHASAADTGTVSEHQPSSRSSTADSATPLDIQKSLATPEVAADQTSNSDVHRSSSPPSGDKTTPFEKQTSVAKDVHTTSPNVQNEISSTATNNYPTTGVTTDESGAGRQISKSPDEPHDKFEHEESSPRSTDERTISEVDRSDHPSSIYSIEQSSTEEYEVSLDTELTDSPSSSFDLLSMPQEERKQSLSPSNTNLWSFSDNKSDFKQSEPSDQTKREETSSSSLVDKPEESSHIDYNSSIITSDQQHNDTSNESNSFVLHDTSKQSSHNSSLTDVEEVDALTSEKSETRPDDNDDPDLAGVMRELRYAFHELANEEDFVEINNDLPDKLLDRLEFHDHVIRTLFDSLLRKYLVQATAQKKRSPTLDWFEFRDILFPMLTGRYTEKHIRKLFELFDTSKDGYLSVQEIAELLQVLQAGDTIHLAQNIIKEYDTDHDGKLSVDELIEAIKKNDDINEHALSNETENQQWFNQSPTDTETITLDVPIISFPPKPDRQASKAVPILGSIFEKVGASSESKQLDSHIQNLSTELTNEFVNHNINIPNDDLQSFIQLFLHQKQNTDSSINWIEFRDVFLPIVNNGFYTKSDIQRWFNIFDTNRNGKLTREEVTHLLRLLQLRNSEEIFNKLDEILETHADKTTPWTLEELTLALENVDETADHLLSDNEQTQQIASFDIAWLSNYAF